MSRWMQITACVVQTSAQRDRSKRPGAHSCPRQGGTRLRRLNRSGRKQDKSRAIEKAEPAPPRALAIDLDSDYPTHAPEKEGARFGSLNTSKRTDRASRFFFVRLPSCASMGRRWRGSLRARWFALVYQSSNPAICRSSRLEAGVRCIHYTKEVPMPSTTPPNQPQQFTLNASEARLVMAYRKMDDRRARETLQFSEDTAIRFTRRVAPVFRVIIGQEEGSVRPAPIAMAPPVSKKSKTSSVTETLRLAVCFGKAVSA